MPSGVRRALDNAADRAIGSRHTERLYLGSMVTLSAVGGALLWLGRRLSR